MILRILFLSAALLFAWSASAQPAGELDTLPLDSLRVRVDNALSAAHHDDLDLLAPRHLARAEEVRKEAESLLDRKGDPGLVRLKFKLALDELKTARESSAAARNKFADLLAARTAALAAGADTLTAGLWRRTEERFRGLVHDYERAPGSIRNDDINDVAGNYRAARRDALRGSILSEARAQIEDVEKKGGNRLVPSLLLRANQAVSRAEADLAGENIDAARGEAQAALRFARQANALMEHITAAQREKNEWEAAILPYTDALNEIAGYLGGDLDLATDPRRLGPQLLALIDARQESLATRVVDQQEMIKSLEASLAEAQTNLADAQNRMGELERRLQNLADERSSNRATRERDAQVADRIARAQQSFAAGEATIVQQQDGTILIRLDGLKFGAGATKLDKARQKVVDHAAEAVRQFPQARIRVDGHTDTEGGADVNQKVSLDRAQAVAAYLARQLKVKPNTIEVQGFGGTRPLTTNDTAEGRARNRRIEIVLTLP